MRNGKILVLGATGKVGAPLVEELTRRGAAVRAAIRGLSKRRLPFNSQVECVEFDFQDQATYSRAFDGIDTLYLLTPVMQNPAELTSRLMDVARSSGVRKVVKQSTYGADTSDHVRLLNWHREAEEVVRGSGIPWVILRPTGFFQNYLTYAQEISDAGVFHLPMGSDRSSYIDARDVARVASVALREPGHEGKIYSLTGPEALSNEDIAEILTQVTGDQIKFVPISEETARRTMREDGVPQWLAEGLIELQRYWRQEKAVEVLPTFRALTGQDPVRFDSFARDQVNSFRRREIA